MFDDVPEEEQCIRCQRQRMGDRAIFCRRCNTDALIAADPYRSDELRPSQMITLGLDREDVSWTRRDRFDNR
jgi:hypothetical protein